ncbi:MAG: hypothetical protein J7L88_00270 [Thermoplasmata archaeon]|nr:hypothetical protein [Thermoplasmata archaeon]
MVSRENENGSKGFFPLSQNLRRHITIAFILLLVCISAFRGIQEMKEREFDRRAEAVYREFLRYSYQSEGAGGSLLIINISRARDFTPPEDISINVRLKLYDGEKIVLLERGRGGGGPFTYERERPLLVHLDGQYVAAILTFRAEGGW